MTSRLAVGGLARGVGGVARNRSTVAAPTFLVVIVALDVVQYSRNWPVPVVGLLDEPAHLLTAALVLLALPPRFWQPDGGWVLLGSVALDIDHVPLFLGDPGFAVDGGRPPTHSLVTVLVLLLGAAAVPKLRRALGGLALGAGLHLLRDVATGPGIPLLWPLTRAAVAVPYLAYLTLLGLLTVLVVVRAGLAHRKPTMNPVPAQQIDQANG